MTAPLRKGNLYVAQECGPRDMTLSVLGVRPRPGVVLGAGLVKIGFTTGPAEDRLMAISCRIRKTMDLIAIFNSNHREELRVLRRFKHLQADTLWGSEWHRPDPEIQDFVSSFSTGTHVDSWARLGLQFRLSPLVRVA